MELPYKAEYSKSGRASCKLCKLHIDKGELRLAAMVQSTFHDGKQPNWFHEKCFYKKQRPLSAGDIENFENLRLEDQQRIEKNIKDASTVVTSKTGKKRSKSENAAVKDFEVEYAKSGRAACRGCEQKILKGQIRIRKTVYDTEVGMKYGGQALWHHVECFAQLRADLGWLEKGEALPGFKSLNQADQEVVKNALPAIKSESSPVEKKPKLEIDKEEQTFIKKLEKQNHRLFHFRDNCQSSMTKPDMIELLEVNGQQHVSGDTEKMVDQLADMLTFGAISPCPECGTSQMLFQKSGYICNGQLTEWTRCLKLIEQPQRAPCKIPSELLKKYRFLKDVSKKTEIRVFRIVPPSEKVLSSQVTVKKEENGPKIKRERPPLYEWTFSQIGLKKYENDLKKRIEALGGKLSSSITEKTVAVLSTPEDVENIKGRMNKVMELGIHVVPMKFIDAVEHDGAGAYNNIISMSICDWGKDLDKRIPDIKETSAKSKSIYSKSVPKSVTLKVKNGLAVDPDSGLEDVAHVYVKGKDKYNAVLGLTDLQRNKNSYYKLQLLVSDVKKKFWVFRSWGRIGTTIGGNKLESYSTLPEAVNAFQEIYLDKSGNDFDNRHNFVKVAGRMYPIDIDYSNEGDNKLSENNETRKSNLDPAVESLIKLIFDIEMMKQTMLEFCLDMEKMPLGKLSQKQIQKAYEVLTQGYNLIQSGGSPSAFIDISNRFYTLIPHNFGVDMPPLLNTIEQIETHRQMLDSLIEIECAFNLIKTEESNDKHPLEKHYLQLKTDIMPLEKTSEEFELLQKYVQNTHAETHKMYDLEIVHIFKVSRQGEERRYKPFKNLHNRKLLWHGSRLANFAGILSHGLKIAPPEAPVTGYMFGKGIYFADMVSKSANYCCTSNQNSTGLLVLAEVALGDMMECTSAKYVTKLPKYKHSCFGRGRTMPNPSESVFRKDGVEIPLGKPILNEKLKSDLLYNEYIVYDVAQVHIEYLFVVKFNYKY